MPAELLLFEHRHAPSRTRATRGKRLVQRTAADHQLVLDANHSIDAHRVGGEHPPRLQHPRAVEPGLGDRGESVEAEPELFSRRHRRGAKGCPVPPVRGIESTWRRVEAPLPRATQRRGNRGWYRNREPGQRGGCEGRGSGDRAGLPLAHRPPVHQRRDVVRADGANASAPRVVHPPSSELTAEPNASMLANIPRVSM